MANWSTQTATRECQIAANGELTVVERLASLLETGQFADVTIRVGEGKDTVTFKAHRLLLATASQPLSNLVTSNMKNGSSGDTVFLHVSDVDPEAFQYILKYIYTDDLQISNVGISLTLLKMGKKWGLPNLVDRTVKFLDAFLNEYEPMNEERKNELCELVVLSEDYSLDLSTKCWNVLLKNVNEVVPCQGFLNMSKAMVRRLLNHPDFHFKNQLVLFESIRDWGMNQVLQRSLSVNSLQGLIGEFLEHVDFKAIQDVDFLDTILPSECLGKAELIAFFMARGLDIPRNLEYTNNQEDSKMPFEKTGRYKRGYKIPNQEIYKEHELRFRVDKRLRLLGVGFGFLFSNTDMGITVHCQGPWETRQWRDIIQTYCRVTWEKMKTADVRLMFSEPVTIEPNHSYKILVRVSRMSAGTSDVDLWGGAQGHSRLKMQDAEFSFLKAAIDPKKEVEDADTENKPGMITDLFYELDDGSEPVSPKNCDKMGYPNAEKSFAPLSKKISIENPTSSNSKKNAFGEPLRENSQSRDNGGNISQEGSTSPSSYSFRRNVPSSRVEVEEYSPPPSTPVKKKTHVDEASSYYLAHRPSSIKGSDAIPAFLRSRQPSVERSKQTWQIPNRTRTSTAAYSALRSREPSVQREPSTPRESGFSSRQSIKGSSRITDSSPLNKYSTGISSIRSKYDSRQPSTSLYNTSQSRYSTSSLSSRYGTSSPRTTMRYTSGGSDTKFNNDTSTTSEKTYSRYGPSSNVSRYERETTASPSRSSATSHSYSRQSQLSSTQNKERDSGTSSPLGTSRYGLTSHSTSRYGTGSQSTSSKSTYGAGSTSTTSSSRANDKNESSSVGSSRYGSSGSTTSSLGTSRYSSVSSSTPSYLSSSRFGVNSSPIGKSYSGFSSRFGSSIYRR